MPRRLLMGSGPSNPEPSVLQAMTAAPLAPGDPTFGLLFDDVAGLVRSVLCAPHTRALAVPGASRAGLEAVLASAVQPGERVMVGVYGHFGELLCTLAARHGASVQRVDAEWGTPVDAEMMAATIRRDRPRLVAIVHADTSTGILQPLELIGRACQDTGTLLLVDAVLSIGGCRVDVDAWSLDASVGGLQKCVGGPPGLALVTLSERMCQAIGSRRSPPGTAYLDMSRLMAQWIDHHDLESAEMPTPMLFAAREALRMIMDEGLDKRWARHRRASHVLRAGLDAMGLRIFGDRAHSAPMITLVQVPSGIEEASVRAQLLEEWGVEIMAAFGPLRGRVWRIGTMGTNASLASVLAVLTALEGVLADRGFGLTRGAGAEAALAASRAEPA